MAKRMQEQKGEEKFLAKLKSTAMNLSSHVPTSSSSAESPIASKSLGILTATEKLESRMRRNSKSDTASSSQVRLQDAYLGRLIDTAMVKLVRIWNPEPSSRRSDDRLLIKQLLGNPMHPVNQTTREIQKLKEKNGHTICVCLQPVHHMEAVFSIVRKIYERGPDDPIDDLDVNMAIWGTFPKTTLQAAVHLGQDYGANLRFVKNHLWNSVGQLFNEIGKLISEQTENYWCKHFQFQRTYVDVDKLVVQQNLSDHQCQSLRLLRLCALCGKMGDDSVATWKSKIKWYSEKQSFQG